MAKQCYVQENDAFRIFPSIAIAVMRRCHHSHRTLLLIAQTSLRRYWSEPYNAHARN